MNIPNTINVNVDVPIQFKGVDSEMHTLYAFNIDYQVACVYSIIENVDGSKMYNYLNTYASMEVLGGLAYFDHGWRIFPESIQQRYAEYVAENEILGGQVGQ